MSSTSLAWLLTYGAGNAAALVQPIFGLVTYLFTYYTYPEIHWWGSGLPPFRWSYFVSVVTVGAFFLRGAGKGSLPVFSHPQTKWLAGLAVIAYLVSPFAIAPSTSYLYAARIVKFLALYLLFAKMIASLRNYRLLILMHVLGGAYWGVEALIDPETEDGRLVNIGGPDTDTNNMTAIQLLTILPFAGYAALFHGGWDRIVGILAAPLLVNTFVLLNSRGAVIALIGAGLVAAALGWRRHRSRVLLGLGLGLVGLLLVAGPKFMSRQASTTRYEEDYSATSRLEMWGAAVRMVRDHPLGVGGHGYDLLSLRYLPEMVDYRGKEQTVHNTYLLAAAEWGVAGFVCFMGFCIALLRQLHRLRSIPPATPVLKRVHIESLAIEVGLVGFLIAGFFSNRVYGEVLYWLGGLSAGLANVAAQETAQTPARTESAAGVAGPPVSERAVIG